ncbi:hypothetical protein F383_22892 [Gossypium arboreum]|uniref:Uncharacterized protein n=1 Tax=Gossypium arboreum TaxID=29729 RepID=A0A0B0NWE1_GOSAR|nr:hypothetical protein F383_22892 [Gossypium arboreum]
MNGHQPIRASELFSALRPLLYSDFDEEEEVSWCTFKVLLTWRRMEKKPVVERPFVEARFWLAAALVFQKPLGFLVPSRYWAHLGHL